MTDPEITAAIESLIASTPPPVTVWGVRYTAFAYGNPSYAAGHIVWNDTEADARDWLAEEQAAGCSAELVRITGRVHPADDTATCGGAR